MGKTGEREGITPELMSFQPVKSDDQRVEPTESPPPFGVLMALE